MSNRMMKNRGKGENENIELYRNVEKKRRGVGENIF